MTDSPPSPRLHRLSSEDYRPRRESLIVAKNDLIERLNQLSKEVGDEAVKSLEKRYQTSIQTLPEPVARPQDDSTSQYLIINFGKINNLKYHIANESAHPIDEATGFLTLTVRSRNRKKKDSKRWEDLLKTTTKEMPLYDMVDGSIIVSIGGEGQKRGGSLELEIRGTLMGSLYSVASTVPFGSFKILFPSSADMSDKMRKGLSEGEHVEFYVQLKMTQIKCQSDSNAPDSPPSRTRIQLVRDMSTEELEACSNSKDHVLLPVTFHMFDPEQYVHTITHFRNLSDLELQRGKERLEQMKTRHESMARSEAEIREARLRDEENCIDSMKLSNREMEIECETEMKRVREKYDSDLRHQMKELEKEIENHNREIQVFQIKESEALETERTLHREEQERAMTRLKDREDKFKAELERIARTQSEKFESEHEARQSKLREEMEMLSQLCECEMKHLREEQSKTESRVKQNLAKEHLVELDLEKQREDLEEQKTIQRRNQYWAKRSYEQSVEQHLNLISLHFREESVVKRREDLAKQRTRYEIEDRALSKTRSRLESLRQEHIERETEHEKELDRKRAEHELKIQRVESEIQVERNRRERRREDSFSNGGLSHLEKLRVLENSFERRLRDKELQQTIGLGLFCRQKMQTLLLEQREELNSQSRNRWREIVESHLIDLEDSELGIDRNYLRLLRDRDDLDDSDVRLMRNSNNSHDVEEEENDNFDDNGHHSMPFGLWRSDAIKDSKQSSAIKRWLGASLLGES
eukprot:g6284.t1